MYFILGINTGVVRYRGKGGGGVINMWGLIIVDTWLDVKGSFLYSFPFSGK